MAEATKAKKVAKAPKLADPVAASIDAGTQEMIKRAQDLGIDTVFDRAVQMKPCNIGVQGICCKNCAMGPCRLPLPKGGIEGEDTRKGLCGATANTIAARNFIRMIAGGAAETLAGVLALDPALGQGQAAGAHGAVLTADTLDADVTGLHLDGAVEDRVDAQVLGALDHLLGTGID